MRISHKTWTSAATIAIFSATFGVSQPARAQVYNGAASTIPAGVNIPVRTSEAIDARTADGRVYNGVVDEDVFDANGRVAIPRGSTAELMVKKSGTDLSIDLESLTINGQRYAVNADASAVGTSGGAKETIENGAGTIGANKDTATYIGGGALLGTIVGAITGGGKGAAIGAAVGAAAGAGAQIYTHGKSVKVPEESLLTFRLGQDLTFARDTGFSRNGLHYHRN